MVKVEEEKPRNSQIQLGPSELGSCREYVRNVLAGSPRQSSSVWPGAAAVGTMVGEYVEEAAAKHLGAVTQVSVTATLPNGLVVTGTADMVFPERNLLADCKTKDGFATVEREGPSLENCIQVSVYTVGLVQAGILSAGASASLIYVDRSGENQTLREVVLNWDQIMAYIDTCVERLDQIVEVQEHIDQGEVEWARSLRDKTPPFCYSERVMCPYRDLCWEGSEWVPNETIEDEDIIAVVAEFVAARQEERDSHDRKMELRERLRGVSGVTPDGHSVVWPEGGRALYVTKVK